MKREIFDAGPRLTVAICTYRRFDVLSSCLDRLYGIGDATPFDVLVIDNSLQESESEQARREYSGRYRNLRYVITERSGLSYARNVALELCETPFMAYLDDDAFVEEGWADAMVHVFTDYGKEVGVVGGRVVPDWEIDKPDWLEGNLLYPYELDLGEGVYRIGEDQWLMGASIAYDVDLLRTVGGFNERLGRNGDLLLCHEEFDVNRRIRDLDRAVVYTGRARVRHVVQRERITQEWVCRNAFWEGVSKGVVETGRDATSFSEKDVDFLSKRCAELQAGHSARTSSIQLLKDRNVFAYEGERAFGEIKFEPFEKQIPDVYIVTPTFNSEAYIDSCIRSVLSQQGDFHLHYHIQDGGSSDQTVARVRQWKERVESGAVPVGAVSCRFTYSTEPDNGIYDAIVKGFSSFDMVAGAVMAWINSDDALMPDAVAKAARALSLNGVDWVCGHQNVRNAEGGVVWQGDLSFPTVMAGAGVCDGKNWAHIQQEGTFWNRRLWDKAGGLDLSFRYAGDWDLWRRFARFSRLVQLPCALGVFTVRDGQASIEHWGEYEAEKERAIPLAERTRSYERFVVGRRYLYTHNIVDRDGRMELVIAPIDPAELAANKGLPVTSLPEAEGGAPDGARLTTAVIGDGAVGPLKECPADAPTLAASLKMPIAGVAEARSSLWDICVDAPALHRLYLRSPRSVQRLLTTVKHRILAPLRSRAKRLRVYMVLQRSGLFFPEYYLQYSPDVRDSGMSPLMHYILHGSAEGRMPNPFFDDNWYRLNYPDVDMAGINPLYHFHRHGWREGRDPGALFSVYRYLELHPDVRERGCCPLTHYLVHGITEGRITE